jgi:hypothetical protein
MQQLLLMWELRHNRITASAFWRGSPALLALGVESDTEQTTLPRICCVLHSEMRGDKMQDLEKMAAKLLETVTLPPRFYPG